MRPAIGCVVLAFACATAQHHTDRPHPDAHSSVDAVLRHAGELELTDAQREALEAIDARTRDQVQAMRGEAKSAAASATDAPPPRRGGGRGGGRRHDPMYVGGGQGQVDARRAQRFRLDELDNAAFLEAEAKLDEAQRPRARELAGAYRAQLFDWRRARDEEGEGDEAPQ
jgi:Spy/CpxP family protein refolding chaperone